jgi:hypothetical protein
LKDILVRGLKDCSRWVGLKGYKGYRWPTAVFAPKSLTFPKLIIGLLRLTYAIPSVKPGTLAGKNLLPLTDKS